MTTPYRYALLGWPVKHSVSPPMQEAGFRACGIPAVYELIETPPKSLAGTVDELKQRGYSGWNATVPHKAAMVDLVDDADPAAELAHSINTVRNDNGRLKGYSTDGYGLATALSESFGLDLKRSAAAFIGTGGAAQAVAVYLALQGMPKIVLANRTVAKAELLAETITGAVPGCQVTVTALPDTAELKKNLQEVDVVIQATSLGLHAGDPLPLPVELLTPHMAVMDMIYGQTLLLQAAAERGCRTADGRGMLLHQGALSFELWTGRKAPVEDMRNALNRALERR